MRHTEGHRTQRIGWLRAAVLGANDGIVSTSSLIIGVASASASRSSVLTSGLAGLVAGAMSMAAGEYVSVSTQLDTEHADLQREREELSSDPVSELDELTSLYEDRGLDADLAAEVAVALTTHGALAAHARDELGLVEGLSARPVQAAATSAVSFGSGASLPLLAAAMTSGRTQMIAVAGISLLFLATLGVLGARAGGAPPARAGLRVTFWGAMAMMVTALIGKAFGTAL